MLLFMFFKYQIHQWISMLAKPCESNMIGPYESNNLKGKEILNVFNQVFFNVICN
jgi:hypothetical protein